jgi:hypothetical protein
VELAPGSWTVVNRGVEQQQAFDDFLSENSGSVRLFEREGGDALIFTPGADPEELATFQVVNPVTWTLPQVPVPTPFAKEKRPDAVPGVEPGGPAKGKPTGLIPGFGGDLLSGDQLAWLLIAGLYLYLNSKRNRS